MACETLDASYELVFTVPVEVTNGQGSFTLVNNEYIFPYSTKTHSLQAKHNGGSTRDCYNDIEPDAGDLTGIDESILIPYSLSVNNK